MSPVSAPDPATPTDTPDPAGPAGTVDAVARAAAAGNERVRADLVDLVRIPSVSMGTFDQSTLDRSSAAVADLLRDAGMPEVEVVRLPADEAAGHGAGRPAVLAHRPGPEGAPTVLLYAHHDVQPPGRDEDWTTTPDGPFEPVEHDGRLYGRGAADDKAGVVAHVGALRALTAAGVLDRLGLGVRVFVEGEEEIGSPTFRPFLEAFRDRLDADVIVVADSSNWRVGVPAVTTSLRGVVGAVVTLRVLDHAVHSGMYGGPVLDAVTLMARLVGTLHNEDGTVAVAGLDVNDHEGVTYDEADYRADAGVLDGVQLSSTDSIASGLWARPALAVTGLDATGVDAASNTLIPACRAKLSMRIAPGQDPRAAAGLLRDHVRANAPLGAEVEVEIEETGPTFRADPADPAMRDAHWALGTAFGTEAVDMGIGGSIPFISDLLEVFPGASILVTGVEDPDSRAHGANESVDLGDLEKVVLAEALLMARLGGAA